MISQRGHVVRGCVGVVGGSDNRVCGRGHKVRGMRGGCQCAVWRLESSRVWRIIGEGGGSCGGKERGTTIVNNSLGRPQNGFWNLDTGILKIDFGTLKLALKCSILTNAWPKHDFK